MNVIIWKESKKKRKYCQLLEYYLLDYYCYYSIIIFFRNISMNQLATVYDQQNQN